jgi:hypothetical protein
MPVYTASASSANILWPSPIEPIWQMLSASGECPPSSKRPDVNLADRLFIAAVVNLPKDQRPWGSITWMADVFATSRPTLYAIGERARDAMTAQPSSRPPQAATLMAGAVPPQAPTNFTVTPNRLARTVLTLLMPGGVSNRTVDDVLQVAFNQGRSVGYVSELLHRAGERAGQILERVDHSVLGPVVQARDELFTRREPNLLLVEPHSLVITGLYATADRDAETWGCALLLTQDRQVQIRGLAEDGCIPYAASCRAAGLDTAIQKDVWHPLADALQVVVDLEREALRELTAAERLEKSLRKRWSESAFVDWAATTQRAERLLAQSAQLRFWREMLWEAVELVDWRNGEIRDRAFNQWLWDESLAALQRLDHPRIQKLVERLRTQAPELLTFLASVEQPLADWQRRVAQHFTAPDWAALFQASVARLWRLEHAVRSGHLQFRAAAQRARQWVAEWMANDPTAQRLAEELLTLLERTVRTSSAAETINSVLRPYLNGRRECTDLGSRQLFLNLFALWFNLHRFERGPRQGKSPYELAGIDLGTNDWLTLLGFPPD